MFDFLEDVVIIILIPVWMFLTYKIYRAWCARITTVSFNGVNGLFDAHLGYIVASGVLAAIPFYLLFVMFTAIVHFISLHYIVFITMTVFLFIGALYKKSKSWIVIFIIFLIFTGSGIYINYSQEKAKQYQIQIEQQRKDQKEKDEIEAQNLIKKYYAQVVTDGTYKNDMLTSGFISEESSYLTNYNNAISFNITNIKVDDKNSQPGDVTLTFDLDYVTRITSIPGKGSVTFPHGIPSTTKETSHHDRVSAGIIRKNDTLLICKLQPLR